MATTAIPAHVLRALAVAATASPKACRRYLEGLPTKPLTKLRVERAAQELGIDLVALRAGK